MEVADSSLSYDRADKLKLYAAAGVPEVWVVNLPSDVIEVYASPQGNTYQESRVVSRGESLDLSHLSLGSVDVDQVLG